MAEPESIFHQSDSNRCGQPLTPEQRPAQVLIVDDDPRILALQSAVLRANGFASRECASGLAALGAVSEGSFDAVLLDIHMPGIDGWEVLRTLQERGVETPVLIVSAGATPAEAALHGADGMLAKPFTITELVSALRAVLHRPNQLPEPDGKHETARPHERGSALVHTR